MTKSDSSSITKHSRNITDYGVWASCKVFSIKVAISRTLTSLLNNCLYSVLQYRNILDESTVNK